MTRRFQQRLPHREGEPQGEFDRVYPKKAGWGRVNPHFAAPSPYPTTREKKEGMVNWEGLARMVRIVKANLAGNREEAMGLAAEAHSPAKQNRLP